jgi:hypothetical protein
MLYRKGNMMRDRELLQQALDALEWAERRYSYANLDLFNKPIEAIRTRLSQPEPEPVAWFYAETSIECKKVALDFELDEKQKANCVPLFFEPPKKEWVGLTIDDWNIGKHSADFISGAEWAESILKAKNGMD